MLRVDGSKLIDLWASDEVLSNHYATSVYHDGHLYGFHGRQEFGPSFRAVELVTGKVRWSEDRFRAGTVTLVGDRLLILRESGELVMAAASPDAFRPLVRAQILPPIVRAYPAIADRFLYVRNENTSCVSISAADANAKMSAVIRPSTPARMRQILTLSAMFAFATAASAQSAAERALDRAIAHFQGGRIVGVGR